LALPFDASVPLAFVSVNGDDAPPASDADHVKLAPPTLLTSRASATSSG
jgi:hypothetical protein